LEEGWKGAKECSSNEEMSTFFFLWIIAGGTAKLKLILTYKRQTLNKKNPHNDCWPTRRMTRATTGLIVA